MIKRFVEFIKEVKLGDIQRITSKSGSDIEGMLRDVKAKSTSFDTSESLINYIDINVDGKKKKAKIFYFDTSDHKIIDRIRTRTEIKSTNEFNIYFSSVVNNEIVPRLGKEIDIRGRYVIYDKEQDFSLVVSIDPERILREDRYRFKLITIIPRKTNGSETSNFIKTIEI